MITSQSSKAVLSRRQFALGALAALLAGKSKSAGFNKYEGPFLITIHAGGGWDLSLYADPKENTPDKPPITHWSADNVTHSSGNIRYAPVGNNQAFFEAHADRMLIINGVDTQTNAHETGELHTWTGSSSAGRPSLSALFAAARGPELPLPYTNFGGFGINKGLVRAAKANPNTLQELLSPRAKPEQELLGRFRSRGFRLLKDRAENNNVEINRISAAQLAQESVPSLNHLYDALSDELAGADAVFNGSNQLTKSLLTSLLIFGQGLGVATECRAEGMWDTHEQGESDQIQLLTYLNDSLMSLWEMAEKLGIADKLMVVVSSDFGRTPYYNSYGGKDHWPTNSYIIMQGGVHWTNRVVGKTDNLQNAMPINPQTLQIDNSKGLIYPKHVHHALHHYLDISQFADSVGFGFGVETLFDFFNPAIAT